MNIEAISGSATVAVACTIVFFLAAKSWQLVARSLGSHPLLPRCSTTVDKEEAKSMTVTQVDRAFATVLHRLPKAASSCFSSMPSSLP